MRRENRRKNTMNSNTIVYISGGILAVAVVAFIITFIVYSNRLNSNSSGILGTEYLSSSENTLENTTEASTEIGKSVEESKNEINNNTLLKEQVEDEYTDVSNNENNKSKTNANKNQNKKCICL